MASPSAVVAALGLGKVVVITPNLVCARACCGCHTHVGLRRTSRTAPLPPMICSVTSDVHRCREACWPTSNATARLLPLSSAIRSQRSKREHTAATGITHGGSCRPLRSTPRRSLTRNRCSHSELASGRARVRVSKELRERPLHSGECRQGGKAGPCPLSGADRGLRWAIVTGVEHGVWGR